MRLILAATVLTALSALPASATEYRIPVTRQLYTCSGGAVSRVALQEPASCCEGQLKCPQLLSTQGLVRERRDPRT